MGIIWICFVSFNSALLPENEIMFTMWLFNDILNAGDKQSPLSSALLPSQTTRSDTELHSLRKRQSFHFGDNKLPPKAPAGQSQTDTKAQSLTASAAASGAAATSLSSVQSAADATAHDDGTGKGKPLRSPDSKPSGPSMAGSDMKQALPAAVQCTAQQSRQIPSSSHDMPPVVKSSRASNTTGNANINKGRRAGVATAPAESSQFAPAQAAVRSPKHAAPIRPDWQH